MGLLHRETLLTKLASTNNAQGDDCVAVPGHGDVCHSDVQEIVQNYYTEQMKEGKIQLVRTSSGFDAPN